MPKRKEVSVKEAAELIGVTPPAVYAWVHEGKIAHRRIASVIAIPLKEVERKKAERGE